MLTDLIRKLWNGRPETLGRALEMRPAGVSRRHFLQAAGITTTVVAMGGTAHALWLPKKELMLEGIGGIAGASRALGREVVASQQTAGAVGAELAGRLGAAVGNDGMIAIGLDADRSVRVSHWFIGKDGHLKRSVEMVADLEKAIEAIGRKADEIGKKPIGVQATVVSEVDAQNARELFGKQSPYAKQLDGLGCNVIVAAKDDLVPVGMLATDRADPMRAYAAAAAMLTTGIEHQNRRLQEQRELGEELQSYETGRISTDRPNFEEVDKKS